MFFTLDRLAVSAKGKNESIDKELTPFIATECAVKTDDIISYKIMRRSLDARKKPDVKLLYRLSVEIKDSACPRNVIADAKQPEQHWNFPETSSLHNPVIVGAGPAGLFAGLVLAMAGCRPVIFERGFDVVKRKDDIDAFFNTRILNPESNLLYGEGGAGTWSDGKLFTRTRDPRMDFVTSQFIESGANENIRYFSHPHIGSDKLPGIITNIREKIISLGGVFQWGCCVENIIASNGVCTGIVLRDGSKINAPAFLIASGHSARDLILNMATAGVTCALKGFQIGSRIEHPQEFINRMQFGTPVPSPALGAAEYNLSSRPAENELIAGATSFCMCPGGEIIPATSTAGQLCTNGMSNSNRDGSFANSAIVTSIKPEIFNTPLEAFHFLDNLEKSAFDIGGGNYTCPAQNARDFLSGASGKLRGKTSYAFGLVSARIDELMPKPQTHALRRALRHFEKIAPGFIENGVFTGIETRISSPLRFERDSITLRSSLKNLYIAGEGAGSAGGIMSSAVDGLKLAEAMIKAFQ